MPGKAKQMLKDLKTGQVYESLYAAGKVIGPAEYAAGGPKNPLGKIKQDQHVWFAIHRDKDNVGRFERSLDGGATFQAFPFAASKRKTKAERDAKAAAKLAKAGGSSNGTAAAASETQAEKIVRLQRELAMETETPEQKVARLQRELAEAQAAPVAAVAEAEETANPAPPVKLAGGMKVVKTG